MQSRTRTPVKGPAKSPLRAQVALPTGGSRRPDPIPGSLVDPELPQMVGIFQACWKSGCDVRRETFGPRPRPWSTQQAACQQRQRAMTRRGRRRQCGFQPHMRSYLLPRGYGVWDRRRQYRIEPLFWILSSIKVEPTARSLSTAFCVASLSRSSVSS